MTRKAAIQMVVGALIAAACLYFFFRNTDFAQLWAALTQANYWWLAPVFAFVLASLVFRMFRWKYLLYEAKDVSLWGLWTPIALGFMGNALLPARAGEAIRVVMLAQRERVPVTTVLASLVMDRFFDMIAVVIVGLLAFSVLPIDASALARYSEEFPFTIEQIRRTIGVSMGGALILGLGALLLLYYQRRRAERLLRALLFFLPGAWRDRILGLLEHFTDGMHVFRSGKHVAYCLLHTVGVWAMILLTFPPLFYAFHIQDQLPLYAPVIMVACASIAVLAPTPGFLGSYQIAMAVALALCNNAIGADGGGVVEAFGIVSWLGTFLPVVLFGFVTLAYEGVSLGALQRAAQEEPGAHPMEALLDGETGGAGEPPAPGPR